MACLRGFVQNGLVRYDDKVYQIPKEAQTAWSPDGRTLAILHDGILTTQEYDGTVMEFMITENVADYFLKWSSDGSMILTLPSGNPYNPNQWQSPQVSQEFDDGAMGGGFVAHLKHGIEQDIVLYQGMSFMGHIQYVHVSPDGGTLIYGSDQHVHIYRNGNLRTYPNPIYSIGWQSAEIGYSTSGKVAFGFLHPHKPVMGDMFLDETTPYACEVILDTLIKRCMAD